MSYLHCHKCHWGQDDFWDFKIKWNKLHKWNYRPFGYNPLSLIMEDFAEWWKPRYIGFDKYAAKDYGFTLNKEGKIHTWTLLCHDLKKHFKRLFTQKWWTYESFKKDYDMGKAKCPKCGSSEDFDID